MSGKRLFEETRKYTQGEEGEKTSEGRRENDRTEVDELMVWPPLEPASLSLPVEPTHRLHSRCQWAATLNDGKTSLAVRNTKLRVTCQKLLVIPPELATHTPARKLSKAAASQLQHQQRDMASINMAYPPQRQVAHGAQSPLSGSEQRNVRAPRPKMRCSISNNTDDDKNSKNNIFTEASTLGATWTTNDTHSVHNHHVPFSSASQTCCAPTRRLLGQQKPCHPQGTDNSRKDARNRAANAIAQTSAQYELAVDFFPFPKKK